MKFVVSLLLVFVFSSFFAQRDSSYYADAPINFPLILGYQNNSAELSHVSRFRLAVLAEYLIENPSYNIIIEGHVCCGPDKRVSKKRAKSVYKHLIKLKVPKEQMKYVGKSFDEPRVLKEKSEEDKDRNRRVEIELIKGNN